MRVKVDYFILCENTFADQHNKPTIVGIFNTINSVGVPVMGPTLTFAYAMSVTVDDPKENTKAELIIKSPSGKNLINGEWGALGIKPEKGEQLIGGGIAIQTPVLEEFGEYKVGLLIAGGKVALSKFYTEEK